MDSKPELIQVVLCEPMKQARIATITNSLASLQQIVGGYIEAVYPFDDPVAIICNEEGKLLGMPGNRRLGGGSVIAGPFLIVGSTEDDFCSLTDSQMEQYSNRFMEPQEISQQEVQDDMGYVLISY